MQNHCDRVWSKAPAKNCLHYVHCVHVYKRFWPGSQAHPPHDKYIHSTLALQGRLSLAADILLLHTHTHTHVHTHTSTRTHIHIHTHMHTCVHTHAYTHTHTPMLIKPVGPPSEPTCFLELLAPPHLMPGCLRQWSTAAGAHACVCVHMRVCMCLRVLGLHIKCPIYVSSSHNVPAHYILCTLRT